MTVGCITDHDESEYRELLKSFVDWCETNCVRLNASKPEETVVDFSRSPHQVLPVNIHRLV